MSKQTSLGVLNRIKPETTIAGLHQVLGRYGVHKVDVRFVPADRYPVIVTMYAAFAAFGTGQTLAEAIDDALARIIHRIGDQIANPPEATSA